MTDPQRPLHTLSDDEIERELVRIAPHLAFPPTPDLAIAVRHAISEQPVKRTNTVRSFPIWRLLPAAAIVVIAVLAGLILSNGFRTTVADVFGVRGVRITVIRDKPTPTVTPTFQGGESMTATPIGSTLLLGQAVSLARARDLSPYSIGVPSELGAPDEVYVRQLPDGNRMVSFLYRPRPTLPETAETGAGALLMQFDSSQPLNYLGKQISDGYQMQPSMVHGSEAIWIDGAHELTLLSDPSRGCCNDTSRTAGNVLLWEEGGITFRLESGLTRDIAIAIAESIQYGDATPISRTDGN